MKILSIVSALLFLGATVFAQDITLPAPATQAGVDVLAAIQNRTVARAFVKKDLPVADLSTILAASLGKRAPDAVASATKAGRVTSFSGDNAYINLYVFNAQGTYAYDAGQNVLKLLTPGDARKSITPEAMNNSAFIALYTVNSALIPAFLKSNPAMAAAIPQATAGFAAQNLGLAASALKLSSIVMYNVKAAGVTAATKIPAEETPLFIVQVGYAH